MLIVSKNKINHYKNCILLGNVKNVKNKMSYKYEKINHHTQTQ